MSTAFEVAFGFLSILRLLALLENKEALLPELDLSRKVEPGGMVLVDRMRAGLAEARRDMGSGPSDGRRDARS